MSESYFKRQELVLGKEISDRIKETKILVVGAGAGGNEVLENLALMGFGHFTIVDFDHVESSNLSRTTLFSTEDIDKSKALVAADVLQKKSLHEKPEIKYYNAKIQDIGKQIIFDHDIVVCCVDTNNARVFLNDWCVRLKKPFFEMGFHKFVVQVSFFPNESKESPCLREIIGYGKFDGLRQSCSKLKMRDTNFQHIPTIQVSSALAGAFVATEIILYLQERSNLKDKMLQYSADYHIANVLETKQSENCLLHTDNELSVLETEIKTASTVRELLEHAKAILGSECLLKFEDDVIISMKCEGCEQEIEIKKFKSDVYDRERWCKSCYEQNKYEEIAISKDWKFISELNLINKHHGEFLDMKLSDLLVKEKDLMRVDLLNDLNKSYLLKIN